MSRYIDADKFTERIKVSPAFCNINDGLLLQRVVIDLLNNAPTADVVPKSEVSILTVQNMALENTKSELQHELNKYKGVENILKDNMGELIMAAIVQAKQELVCEIFAEVNMQIFPYSTDIYIKGEELIIIPKSDYNAILAEFKKKYTEGKDKPASEEKHFSPEDVSKMTPQEVKEKYTAIRRSMERW